MKRHWIEFHDRWKHSPMTFWVHLPADGNDWRQVQEFDPPAPKPVPGSGFAYFHVEIDGFTFQFASLDEMRTLIEVFSKKLLPSNLKLTIERGAGYGPSNHWLNRIPKLATSWRYREGAVKYLNIALADFEAQLTDVLIKR